jgi:hypothetical protein
VFTVPVTVAVNCCVAFGDTVAEVGEIEMPTAGTVTEALAVLVVSAWDWAWTVSPSWRLGAVNRPDEFTVPVPEVTDQFTFVLVVPVTVAVNCCMPPSFTVAEVGEMLIRTPPPAVPLP